MFRIILKLQILESPGKYGIYTKQTILCSGATERSIVFENNDRPGIMLSGAIRNYVNRWAVTPIKMWQSLQIIMMAT